MEAIYNFLKENECLDEHIGSVEDLDAELNNGLKLCYEFDGVTIIVTK